MVLPMWAMVPGSRHVTNMDLSRACSLSFEGLAVGLCCRTSINCAPSADAAERIEHLMVHIRKGFKNTGPRTMRSLPLTFNRYNVMPCIFKTISCDATQLHGPSLRFPMSYHAMSCHVMLRHFGSSPAQTGHVTLSQLGSSQMALYHGKHVWLLQLVYCVTLLTFCLSLSLVLPSSYVSDSTGL